MSSQAADQAEATGVANLECTAPAVLNISGRTWTEPKVGPTEIPAMPTINQCTFPGILSKILLNCDKAPTTPNPYKSNHYRQYVASVCLINQKANKRIFHIFRTHEKDYYKDYDSVKKLYENKCDIKIRNEYSVPTLCARALYRGIQEDLRECKQTREGIVYETTLADSDEWEIRNKLDSLFKLEWEKLINYIKFVSIYRQ